MELDSLKRWVREQLLPTARQRDEAGEFPVPLFKQLHEMGWFQALVPAELGGLGIGAEGLTEFFRALSYGSRGVATSMTGHLAATTALFGFAEEPLKQLYAREQLLNLALTSFCFTEPDAGSDVLRIKTQARQAPGGYRLSGSKCFITNSGFATALVVVARLEGEQDRRRALSLFYIPATSAGVTRGKALDKLGHRDSNTGELFFDDVFVPGEYRIGAEGDGMKIAQIALQKSRTMIAASALGLCDRANDLVLEHLTQRTLYGKPLATQPAIRGAWVQLRTEMQAAWHLVTDAARHWDTGRSAMEQACMAKLFAGQVAVRVSNQALELFGGYGYTREFEVERLFRDAKLYEIIEGPVFVLQAILAREIFPFERTEDRAALKKSAA